MLRLCFEYLFVTFPLSCLHSGFDFTNVRILEEWKEKTVGTSNQKTETFDEATDQTVFAIGPELEAGSALQ